MTVKKVFDGGLLVSLKKEHEPPPLKHHKIVKLLASGRANQKAALYAYEELEAELYSLRRQLITAERLIKVRTKERNSARNAHKKRLEEIDDLKYRLVDFEFQVEALEEEKQELANLVTKLNRTNVSRSAAATPVKK